MSRDNLALVLRFEDSWSRADLEAALACVASDFEFDWSNSIGPFKGTYRGHEGLRKFWSEVREAWENFSPQAEDHIDCGDDRLITLDVVRARGRGSGIDMEAHGAMLGTLRGGKIARIKMFQNKDEALRAVGESA